ncbi:MAG: hypothetical protein RIQ59_59, partial [Bacteroidota bacterium]
EAFEIYQPHVKLVQEKSITEELFEMTSENISPFIIES